MSLLQLFLFLAENSPLILSRVLHILNISFRISPIKSGVFPRSRSSSDTRVVNARESLVRQTYTKQQAQLFKIC